MNHSAVPPPLVLKPCCLNLRHKMMYCDPRQATPGLVDDRSTTRIYLCVLTQEVLGPDGAPVSPRDCGEGRACHVPSPRPIQGPERSPGDNPPLNLA